MKSIKIVLSKEAEEIYRYLSQESKISKNERIILKAVKQKTEITKIHWMF